MVQAIRLLDFRCFSALSLRVPAEGVLLVGENAQGKTSILEALCVLIRLHSPRSNRMATLARIGSTGFGVTGEAWQGQRSVRYADGGLILRANHQPVESQSEYLKDGGRVVWLGNEDLDLVRGPAESRRRFLDFIASQIDPHYRVSFSRYKRALRAKNFLLKEIRSRDAEIQSYEEIMIESGTHLIQRREQVIHELATLAATAQNDISGINEALTMRYLPASGPDLRESMLQARDREIRMRQAVVGPHRDDLDLRLHGMPAASYASEGQQRTLAIALKLAQGKLLEIHTGQLPIYLIDDVFGELDPQRRNALMRHLPQQAQKWITSTHLDWLHDYPELAALARLRISNNQVIPF